MPKAKMRKKMMAFNSNALRLELLRVFGSYAKTGEELGVSSQRISQIVAAGQYNRDFRDKLAHAVYDGKTIDLRYVEFGERDKNYAASYPSASATEMEKGLMVAEQIESYKLQGVDSDDIFIDKVAVEDGTLITFYKKRISVPAVSPSRDFEEKRPPSPLFTVRAAAKPTQPPSGIEFEKDQEP